MGFVEVEISTQGKSTERIINISEETKNFIRIDMESSKHTDFTIQSFIKVDQGGIPLTFWSTGNDGDPENSLAFYASTSEVYAYWEYSGGTNYVFAPEAGLTADTWALVSIVYDGDILKIFVDGILAVFAFFMARRKAGLTSGSPPPSLAAREISFVPMEISAAFVYALIIGSSDPLASPGASSTSV